jgi:predicted nucleotidyltransferase
VASGVSIRVAPIPVVCVLKMVAYQDQPHARTRDLEDLAHILDEYVPADDPRRYSDEVHETGLDFDMVSAYLLGRDIGALVNGEEHAAVASFIAKVRDEPDSHGTQARMANSAPVSWRRDPEALLARLEAFERGLGSPASA